MPRSQRIKTQNMRVATLRGLVKFYTEILGMSVVAQQPQQLSFGFATRSCSLVFSVAPVTPYQPRSDSYYWKIDITVLDLDAAVCFLRERGVTVSDPTQFVDIGYLCHLTDPNGFVIELLQQEFEGSATAVIGDKKPKIVELVFQYHPIAYCANLAHITLRVTDLIKAQAYFSKTLGMRLMSIQPVPQYQFCLYFYSWSNQQLPVTDLCAVENREWLWARPYTFIELQHLQLESAAMQWDETSCAGWAGFSYGFDDSVDFSFVSAQQLQQLL